MADDRPLVPVIVGATGVGKTAVTLALRHHLSIGVLSADSRQVYRGLDVGTAKPSRAERSVLPHWGIDVVDVGEPYSAGRFARDAAEWTRQILADGLQPVVVGGTGFYVRALTDGLFDEPAMDPGRVRAFRSWARAGEEARVQRWARRLDRTYRGGGLQRAARAVEVVLFSGHTLGEWQARHHRVGPVRPWFVHLVLRREDLYARLLARAQEMVQGGLIEETRQVLRAGHHPSSPGLDGIGYREAVSVLEGRLDIGELATTIATASRQYAKRQTTWFRHQLSGGPVRELDAARPAEHLAMDIVEAWGLVKED